MGAARWQVPRNSLRLVAVGGALTCTTGKQPFTQAQAAGKARRAWRRYSTGMAAYRCAECGSWHFGHHYSHKQQLPVIRRDHHIHSPTTGRYFLRHTS